MNKKELSAMIDQTLLSACATEAQVREFCTQARGYGFASVCINPAFVALASSVLKGSETKVCTVIDFPLGAGGVSTKVEQAKLVLADGADELDFVVNLGLVKAHDYEALRSELSECVKAVKAVRKDAVTKIILETCLLDDDEIVQSCLAAKDAGFDFVKTSTGFAIVKDKDSKLLPNGASVHAVSLMRKTVGPDMGVKASGGIHNTAQALELVAAGASRIGASAGVAIVDGMEQ